MRVMLVVLLLGFCVPTLAGAQVTFEGCVDLPTPCNAIVPFLKPACPRIQIGPDLTQSAASLESVRPTQMDSSSK